MTIPDPTYISVDEVVANSLVAALIELEPADITKLIQRAESHIDRYVGRQQHHPDDENTDRVFPREVDYDDEGAAIIPLPVSEACLAQVEYLYLQWWSVRETGSMPVQRDVTTESIGGDGSYSASYADEGKVFADATLCAQAKMFLNGFVSAVAFETILAKISTVATSSTKADIKALGDQVLEMSKSFPKSKEELGIGLYNILQAGIEDTSDAMKILELSTKAAIGGQTDVGTATKVVTNIMGAYGQTADEASKSMDAVFVAAQMGKAEFPELAAAMGNVLQTASQLNVPISDVTAAIETMVNAGQSADEAGTSLNALLTSVIQASKGTGEAADEAKRLGLEYNSTALRTKGLQLFMADLQKAVGDDEVAMQILSGNVRGFRAAASIAGKGSQEFTAILKAQGEATGAVDSAYQKMADTTENKWTVAMNDAAIVAQTFGEELLPELNKDIDLFREVMLAAIPVAETLGIVLAQMMAGVRIAIESIPKMIPGLQTALALARGIHGLFPSGESDSAPAPKNTIPFGPVNNPNPKPPPPRGGGGGKDEAKKLADELQKAEDGFIKALGEEGKANKENLDLKRSELLLRQKLGLLTSREALELERINRRLDYKTDAIEDATRAWEDQHSVVQSLKKDIEGINDDIKKQAKDLKKTFADIDRESQKKKNETAADLVKERNDILAKAGGSEGITGDASRRLGEINSLLATQSPETQQAGEDLGKLNDFQKIDEDAKQKKLEAAQEANQKLEDSITSLTIKQTELNQAQAAETDAINSIIRAQDTLRIVTDSNFKAIEDRTTLHVNQQIAEFTRLSLALGATGAPVPGFATGGVIRGPGGPTGDKILARLSDGERIISASTNKMYAPILQAIHNRSFPIPRFKDGGVVTQNNQKSSNIVINNHGQAAMVYADPRRARWDRRKFLG